MCVLWRVTTHAYAYELTHETDLGIFSRVVTAWSLPSSGVSRWRAGDPGELAGDAR